MNILQITLVAITDFHTTSEAKGSSIDYLTDVNEIPYIPGTHIKGVMRTEAERIIRSVEGISCWITGDLDMIGASKDDKRKVKTCDELKNGGFGCDVCRVFGLPNTVGGGKYREGKIRITNFKASGKVISASRMHVSIDRDTLTNRSGALSQTRVVPSGCKFTGYIIARNLKDSEDNLLRASIYSMCHYGLGGERSRGLGSFDVEKIESITYEDFLNRGVI